MRGRWVELVRRLLPPGLLSSHEGAAKRFAGVRFSFAAFDLPHSLFVDLGGVFLGQWCYGFRNAPRCFRYARHRADGSTSHLVVFPFLAPLLSTAAAASAFLSGHVVRLKSATVASVFFYMDMER